MQTRVWHSVLAMFMWRIARESLRGFFNDNALRLSAALAYYSIFSLAPLLILAIAVASLAFGEEAVRGEVQTQLQGMVGPKAAETIQSMIAARSPTENLAATLVGLITLLLGAAGVFGQLQDALNTIWGVKRAPGGGFRRMIKDRFLSFAMVLGAGFVLLISMVVSAALEIAMKHFSAFFAMSIPTVQVVNMLVGFLVATGLFAMIFKVLPDVRLHWNDVWLGALVTAVLFSIGKYGISLYLGREGTASAYGAAGSVVLILLWIYYSSAILFFGAEVTRAHSKANENSPVPEPAEVLASIRATPEMAPAAGRDWGMIFGTLSAGILTGWWLRKDR